LVIAIFLERLMNACPECKREFADTVRFCEDCGAKLSPKSQSVPVSEPGIRIQDGVVAGGIHISSTDSRTIIRQQDETREVLKCDLCGAHVPKPEGFTCPKCSRFVCARDYGKEQKLCSECLDFQATAALSQYRALLDKVMQDGRIDPEERAQLDRARASLGLNADLCAQLEKERRAVSVAASGGLGRRDQVLLDEARQLLLGEFKFSEALRAIQSLHERFADHPEIRRIYLLAILEAEPDRAFEVIEAMRFDDLQKSLAHMELLARRGDFDRAYDILKEARRAFGVLHSELLAGEADLVLEESRRTGTKSLLEVAAECLGRLDASSSDYARYAHTFQLYMKGESRALDLLAQAGNYYARRKKQWIARSATKAATSAVKQVEEPTKPKGDPVLSFTSSVILQAPPPPEPPPPLLMPGTWQLRLVSMWGQNFYGTCQITVNGPNAVLIVDVSGQVMLWDGLLHYFQERSIFRGSVTGTNLFATCGELVRMVDGMVVPVPGLPVRFNAVVADMGRSVTGTVVNSLGESSQVFLKI
jgi:hypothetical protein